MCHRGLIPHWNSLHWTHSDGMRRAGSINTCSIPANHLCFFSLADSASHSAQIFPLCSHTPF
jgi:hypothetical protein